MLDRHNEHCNTTDMLVMLEFRSEKPQMNTGVLPGLNIDFGVLSISHRMVEMSFAIKI